MAGQVLLPSVPGIARQGLQHLDLRQDSFPRKSKGGGLIDSPFSALEVRSPSAHFAPPVRGECVVQMPPGLFPVGRVDGIPFRRDPKPRTHRGPTQ
eukprot:10705636-Heterocapsa_arctica.AAC.1